MPRESKAKLTERAGKIVSALKKAYPRAGCSLDRKNPLQLLVATILSAQCTDVRVNIVTKDLFKKYRSARAFANAPAGQLEADIRSTGFYRNKARNIRLACAKIIEDFDGKVPGDMASLLTLAGVARKTANVVLGTAFGVNVGIVVDTHVTRISGRLKLTRHENNQGDRIEKDLMAMVPREEWTRLPHMLIAHGRSVCTARKPDCEHCPLALKNLCPSAGKV